MAQVSDTVLFYVSPDAAPVPAIVHALHSDGAADLTLLQGYAQLAGRIPSEANATAGACFYRERPAPALPQPADDPRVAALVNKVDYLEKTVPDMLGLTDRVHALEHPPLDHEAVPVAPQPLTVDPVA